MNSLIRTAFFLLAALACTACAHTGGPDSVRPNQGTDHSDRFVEP